MDLIDRFSIQKESIDKFSEYRIWRCVIFKPIFIPIFYELRLQLIFCDGEYIVMMKEKSDKFDNFFRNWIRWWGSMVREEFGFQNVVKWNIINYAFCTQPLKSVASVWDNFDSHCTIQLLYTCWKFEIRVLNMRFVCAPFCRSKHTTLTHTFAKQNQNQSRMLKHVLCVRSHSQNQLKHTLHLFYSCSVTRKKFNFSFPYVAIFSMEFGSEVARTP